MKQFLSCFVVFVLLSFFLLSFKMDSLKEKENFKENKKKEIVEEPEKRALFFSYIECSHYLQDKTSEEAKQNILSILNTMKENQFNMLLLQVRSFSDAIYPSSIFPSSKTVVDKEGDPLPFDFLSYFIEQAHQRKIEVHAWINPYRIRNAVDMENISPQNPARKALEEGYAKEIEGKGLFYNPAREETKQLILKGIKEILENYDVDGIHFDDYFYPDLEIDSIEYEQARKEQPTVTHDAFRLSQVSSLIKQVYNLVKEKNSSLLFGISPEGNIENNYTSNFVDTKRFGKEEGFIDYLMPQIYFGFLNERKPFLEVVKEWDHLIQLDSISLLPALAFYKVGKEDQYALSGKNEWLENGNIIQKEVIASRAMSHYEGFSLFRYDSLFGEEQTTLVNLEKENLKEALQEF